MSVDNFVYEEITEGDFDFDFYVVYMQTECDDPYYPPYKSDVGIYKSKENAIDSTRKKFYKMSERYTSAEGRKYGGVDATFYIEGAYFEDNATTTDENKVSGKKNKSKNDKPLYVIYDKEEQAKIEARWETIHRGSLF